VLKRILKTRPQDVDFTEVYVSYQTYAAGEHDNGPSSSIKIGHFWTRDASAGFSVKTSLQRVVCFIRLLCRGFFFLICPLVLLVFTGIYVDCSSDVTSNEHLPPAICCHSWKRTKHIGMKECE